MVPTLHINEDVKESVVNHEVVPLAVELGWRPDG